MAGPTTAAEYIAEYRDVIRKFKQGINNAETDAVAKRFYKAAGDGIVDEATARRLLLEADEAIRPFLKDYQASLAPAPKPAPKRVQPAAMRRDQRLDMEAQTGPDAGNTQPKRTRPEAMAAMLRQDERGKHMGQMSETKRRLIQQLLQAQ